MSAPWPVHRGVVQRKVFDGAHLVSAGVDWFVNFARGKKIFVTLTENSVSVGITNKLQDTVPCAVYALHYQRVTWSDGRRTFEKNKILFLVELHSTFLADANDSKTDGRRVYLN